MIAMDSVGWIQIAGFIAFASFAFACGVLAALHGEDHE